MVGVGSNRSLGHRQGQATSEAPTRLVSFGLRRTNGWHDQTESPGQRRGFLFELLPASGIERRS